MSARISFHGFERGGGEGAYLDITIKVKERSIRILCRSDEMRLGRVSMPYPTR
jgi:hypothetical protein